MVDSISIIAIIVAAVSGGVAIASLVLSWNKSKFEKLTHESQFISDIQHELTEHDYMMDQSKTQRDCLSYVWNYLNTLDRLCYFDSRNWLDDEIIAYFRNYLEMAIKFQKWLSSVGYMFEQETPNWNYFLKTCKKHSIEESKIKLPIPMREFNRLQP